MTRFVVEQDRLDFDTITMHRTSDSASSVEASRRVHIAVRETDRDAVLRLLRAAGPEGLTDHCLAHLMSTPDNPRKQTSVGKRRFELVELGYAAPLMRLVGDVWAQVRRIPIAGSRIRCDVWIAT